MTLPDPEYAGQTEADLDDAVFDAYPDDFELLDRAWCVVHDVDSRFAGVAGSAQAIRGLSAAPVIEVKAADRHTESIVLYD